MANQFLNDQEYANVGLMMLKNQLVFGRLVDGQFKGDVTNTNGLTVNVKRPPRFIDKSDGTANLALQDIVVGSAPLAVNHYAKAHVQAGDIEYASSYNALMQNMTMKAAMARMAQTIDSYIADLTLGFHSWVAGGEPTETSNVAIDATDPTQGIRGPGQAMAAHTRLMSQGVPNADLTGIVGFDDGQRIRGTLLSDFTPSVNADALARVRIPLISEVNWYASQNLPVLTAGTRVQGDGSSTGAQVNGANQNVDYEDVKGAAGTSGYLQQTLNIDGAAQAGLTFKKGDVFTIAGVYAWDWRSQQALGYLQQFTVLADATGAASTGVAALTISPAIIVPNTGANQNIKDTNSAFATCDSVPADNAYIEFAGAASAKMTIRPVFHKQAIALASVRLQTPFSGTASFATDPETGIAIRYWRASDVSTGEHVHRWDCYFGAAVMDPFLGTRLCGQAKPV